MSKKLTEPDIIVAIGDSFAVQKAIKKTPELKEKVPALANIAVYSLPAYVNISIFDYPFSLRKWSDAMAD